MGPGTSWTKTRVPEPLTDRNEAGSSLGCSLSLTLTGYFPPTRKAFVPFETRALEAEVISPLVIPDYLYLSVCSLSCPPGTLRTPNSQHPERGLRCRRCLRGLVNGQRMVIALDVFVTASSVLGTRGHPSCGIYQTIPSVHTDGFPAWPPRGAGGGLGGAGVGGAQTLPGQQQGGETLPCATSPSQRGSSHVTGEDGCTRQRHPVQLPKSSGKPRCLPSGHARLPSVSEGTEPSQQSPLSSRTTQMPGEQCLELPAPAPMLQGHPPPSTAPRTIPPLVTNEDLHKKPPTGPRQRHQTSSLRNQG